MPWKYPCVTQYSEEDCGAACLATVSRYYGRVFTLNRMREAVGTGQLGTTLLGLRRGAENLGFNARQVRGTEQLLDRLNEAPLPAIIHWKGNHWVVLYGKRGRKYMIADPAIGIRILSRSELLDGWVNGIMLLLVPDEVRFYEQSADKIKGFGQFFGRVWRFKNIFLQIFALNLAVGVLSLALPFLIQILTDDVLVRGDRQLLRTVAIGVIAVTVFSNLLKLVQSNLVAHFSERLELGFVLEFGRQILRLPLTYYEARRSGEVVSRLSDIQQINKLVSQVVISLPTQLFVGVISAGLMGFYSVKLAAVAGVVALSMTLSTLAFLPLLQQKTRSLLVTEAETQGVVVETFKGALTLKTTNAAPQVWEELQSRFSRLAKTSLSTVQIGVFNSVFSDVVSGVGNVAILWVGSSLVIDKELTIGQLFAFNTMNNNFIRFIDLVISFVDEYAFTRTATERISEVIDSPAEDQHEGDKAWAVISFDADITCSHLTFHHAGRIALLQDFTLTLPGGKVTALIGQSGCGKSTLAKLIAGLYPLPSGNVRYGTYNQQDLSLECRRQQVILVPQDAHFWSRSIIENFRLSYPNISFEQIVRACEVAGADEFISELPDKYQTVLGEFGANLSGGQKQRLAIARAIAFNPAVLILDEATAGLDPVLEMTVLDKLFAYRQGKTTIIISHRPRVIVRADWIVYLEKGTLVLAGTLEELAQKTGAHLDFLRP